jgi:hypothetical protein
MNRERLFENEKPEGRAGVVLEAPPRGFVLVTTKTGALALIAQLPA